MLPLFPLGTVLFPGLVLPLHVFEERYRQLVRDLLELPDEDRCFGVVCIREGREVGTDGITALYDVGCLAQLSQVRGYDDGRYDLVTVGTTRFHLEEVFDDQPYLTGRVRFFDVEASPTHEARLLDPLVRTAFGQYVEQLALASGSELSLPDLPDDPEVLGNLVGATMALDLADRQDLLEQADGAARLRRALSLLRREAGVLSALRAVPAPELARAHALPN